jgi:hypothetical protein
LQLGRAMRSTLQNPWAHELLQLGRRKFLRGAAMTGEVLGIGGFGLDRDADPPVPVPAVSEPLRPRTRRRRRSPVLRLCSASQ